MVGPAALRPAVVELEAKFAMKKGRACRVVGLASSTLYYRTLRPERSDIPARLRELAAQRPRWGYLRLHVLLDREGHHLNHKLVFHPYTFCSHLAMRGGAAKAIHELAGHTHLATTMRYMHLAEGHKEQTIRLLDRRAGPAANAANKPSLRGGEREVTHP
jgi:hypothetical protein